jgi:hypothetical protein
MPTFPTAAWSDQPLMVLATWTTRRGTHMRVSAAREGEDVPWYFVDMREPTDDRWRVFCRDETLDGAIEQMLSEV